MVPNLLALLVGAAPVLSAVVRQQSPVNVSQECTNPVVRREWRSLSPDERQQWLDAIKCMASLPHTDDLVVDVGKGDIGPINASGSYYDDFAYVHMDQNPVVHFTARFFPFHRAYVHKIDEKMRTLCNYTGPSAPYWDWSLDAADLEHSTMFSPDVNVSGLGGWGDPENDFQLVDGAFADLHLTYPSPHRLRRNFTQYPFATEGKDPQFYTQPWMPGNETFQGDLLRNLTQGYVGDYKGFHSKVEAFLTAHAAGHQMVGGDMGGICPTGDTECVPGATFTTNDPLFWLHHSMVDKMWFDWQHAHVEENFYLIEGGLTPHIENATIYAQYTTGGPPALDFDTSLPNNGMWEDLTVWDVMNTTAGILCYVYE
ncbi:hypothetical protein FB107DRAFT_217193 [Schizophyllum commune]